MSSTFHLQNLSSDNSPLRRASDSGSGAATLSSPIPQQPSPSPITKSPMTKIDQATSFGDLSTTSTQAREFIRFRCPTCNEIVFSIDEALSHCGDLQRLRTSGGATPSGSPESLPGLPSGETIAFDERGKPSIVRTVDPETGEAKTLVKNDDGSTKTFDEAAVSSLTSSNAEELQSFVETLTHHQLRGLVHEVGQRLLERSQLYHTRLSELERLGECLNLRYFGLGADATERDLDNAYRKLAKKMHPDKNGGTEHAKKRFQDMKERYEALKKKLNGEDSSKDRATEEGEKSEEKDTEPDSKDDKKSTSIEYDPSDKECMIQTVSRMAKQLANIDIQMKVLLQELRRAQSQA